MSAFVDTNILARHLTGDPPAMAARATAYLETESEMLLTDLVAAETMYVLESFCGAPREQVAEAMRSLLAFHSIVCVDPALLLRAVEVYETERIDFAEAYLVGCAESSGWQRSRRSTGRSIASERFAESSHPAFDGAHQSIRRGATVSCAGMAAIAPILGDYTAVRTHETRERPTRIACAVHLCGGR